MTLRSARLVAPAMAALIVAAGCGPQPPATSNVAASAGAVEATTAVAPACSEDGGMAVDLPEWPLTGGGAAAFQPVIMSSLLSAGPNRFLYNVLDASYRQLAAEDVASRTDFYAIERDAVTPVASVEATYLGSGLGRGLYRAEVDFDCIGEWGAEVFLQGRDGGWASERLRFAVEAAGTTPAIGDEVPLSDSLTAATPEEVALISSDPHPYLAAYDKTVAETVSAGRPALVFFATPAFCQTGYCGPTMELVKGIAREYEGRVGYVNVEPYELEMTDAGLQPRLDETGQLQPVRAALEWGIPVEPYLFLLDAEGRVFARFEGIVGGDELRAALEDVLGA